MGFMYIRIHGGDCARCNYAALATIDVLMAAPSSSNLEAFDSVCQDCEDENTSSNLGLTDFALMCSIRSYFSLILKALQVTLLQNQK